MKFSVLVEKTIRHIVVSDDRTEILINTDDGALYKMFHDQECCEGVGIKDIDGDLNDLVGDKILMADVETNEALNPGEYREGEFLWTFYRIRTAKVYISICWLGTSNGYYSMGVSFDKI
jgi:hypothetical protein